MFCRWMCVISYGVYIHTSTYSYASNVVIIFGFYLRFSVEFFFFVLYPYVWIACLLVRRCCCCCCCLMITTPFKVLRIGWNTTLNLMHTIIILFGIFFCSFVLFFFVFVCFFFLLSLMIFYHVSINTTYTRTLTLTHTFIYTHVRSQKKLNKKKKWREIYVCLCMRAFMAY